MISMTWTELNKQPFINAMLKLSNSDELDRVTAYRVGRIVDVARKALKTAHEKEMKLATELAELDGTGNVVFVETPMGKRPKVHKDNEGKFNEEMTKMFEENKVDIKVHKLDFNQLVGLSGEQLIAIESICDNIPEEA